MELDVREETLPIPRPVAGLRAAAVPLRQRLRRGDVLEEAVIGGARETFRAIITTAAVAALGFLPMALATGAGSEVQRPLATVVIFGIFGATALTLFLFPGVLLLLVRPQAKHVEAVARSRR